MDNTASRLASAASDPDVCRALLQRLDKTLAGRPMRFMEVCGTHTVAIFQSGLRALLPSNVEHLSGPGCPVCVTHESEIALLLELGARRDLILATFGDLMRVPGPGGASLKTIRAEGGDIRIVYSPLDALKLASANPGKQVVFAGIGFETTAPTTAAAIISAKAQGLGNFSLLSLHKLVPPALEALLAKNDGHIDAFLLPGHVATVAGLEPFRFLASRHAKPAAVGGFEPADILIALCALAAQLKSGAAKVENAYPRGAADNGNPRARAILAQVFEPDDGLWRGIGAIPASGLTIRAGFSDFDAKRRFGLEPRPAEPPKGCLCGEVLQGRARPSDCSLFGKICAPSNPVGPCMVSTEGSCAAWHRYGISE